MLKYCQRARKLLVDSANNVNPYETFKPDVPTGFYIQPGTEHFDALEEAGLDELSKIGFVLIAGGLGERLGFSSIKISLPVITVVEDYSYMQFYAEYALACKEAALKRDPSLDRATFYVPFAIMVSDDTYDRTIKLLESHNYFGLGKDRVDIIKQENVPAMMDNSARLATKDGKVETKPHGHGDIHNLLFDSGVASKWLAMGKDWMIFI
jgi:UDP-sugar pyrophosphorylase